MIDLVKLILVAGDGGNGKVSFRRERRVPKGGPDGGDGGDGGSIIIKGSKDLATLKDFKGKILFEAEDGMAGGKKKKIGNKGKSLMLKVPLGTVISVLAQNGVAKKRRMFVGVNSLLRKDDVRQDKYYLEKEGQVIPLREVDNFYLTGKLKNGAEVVVEPDESIYPDVQEVLNATKDIIPLELLTIKQHDQEVVICQGGFGGRGNDRFKSSRLVTPLEAEYGTFGEKNAVILELKLLADVGLVGFPNAGKSTLLSVITKAKPKIASYPFTTIEPNLGIIQFSEYGVAKDGKQEVVLADIPGLIAGASEGKGLGHSFLRHVENCSTMLFVLALDEATIFNEKLSNQEKAEQLYNQLLALKKELKQHRSNVLSKDLFVDKKFLVSVNKQDLYSTALQQEISKYFKNKGVEITMFSGVTKQNLTTLVKKIQELV